MRRRIFPHPREPADLFASRCTFLSRAFCMQRFRYVAELGQESFLQRAGQPVLARKDTDRAYGVRDLGFDRGEQSCRHFDGDLITGKQGQKIATCQNATYGCNRRALYRCLGALDAGAVKNLLPPFEKIGCVRPDGSMGIGRGLQGWACVLREDDRPCR